MTENAPIWVIADHETFGLHFLRACEESDLICQNTSLFDEEPDETTRFLLSQDGRSGFGIRWNGELVFVWSQVKGRGDHIVAKAVRSGATFLDCFDGPLVDLYSRHGFEVDHRAANWTEGGPDVVYMVHNSRKW